MEAPFSVVTQTVLFEFGALDATRNAILAELPIFFFVVSMTLSCGIRLKLVMLNVRILFTWLDTHAF